MGFFKSEKPTDSLLSSLPPQLSEIVDKLKANQNLWMNQAMIDSGMKPGITPDRQTYLQTQQNWIIIYQLNEISKKLDKLIAK